MEKTSQNLDGGKPSDHAEQKGAESSREKWWRFRRMLQHRSQLNESAKIVANRWVPKTH